MHATFDQFELSGRETPFMRVPSPQAARVESAPPPPAPPAWQPAGGYGGRRMRPGAIAAIVLGHAALLIAVVKLDVLTVHKPKAEPLVVTLLAEQPAPPPEPAAPTQEVKPVTPVTPKVVAPDPIVVTPQPAPAIATVRDVPPPPAPAAAPAAAAPTIAAEPIVPPDGSAASLKNPAPKYPVESRRKREEGAVRLRVVITPDGLVKAISVARSSGFERLDEAALDTVRKWKFKPGMQAGNPVEAVGFLVIPFKLAN